MASVIDEVCSTALQSHVQDFDALAGYMRNQSGVPFLSAISDFHLLLYLYTGEVVGFQFKVSPIPRPHNQA